MYVRHRDLVATSRDIIINSRDLFVVFDPINKININNHLLLPIRVLEFGGGDF